MLAKEKFVLVQPYCVHVPPRTSMLIITNFDFGPASKRMMQHLYFQKLLKQANKMGVIDPLDADQGQSL